MDKDVLFVIARMKKLSDGFQATVRTVKGNVWDVTAEPPHRPSLKAVRAGVQRRERMKNPERADGAPGRRSEPRLPRTCLFPYSDSGCLGLSEGQERHPCPCTAAGGQGREKVNGSSRVSWPWEGGVRTGPLDRRTPILVNPRHRSGMWLCCVSTIASCQNQDRTGCDFKPRCHKHAAEKCVHDRHS